MTAVQGNGMVVAEIFSVKPHPNADRLKVCSVDLGHDVAQVVTNAANAAAGMKVIFAVQTLALLCAPCIFKHTVDTCMLLLLFSCFSLGNP